MVLGAATLVAALYAVENARINSDNTRLVDQEEPFRYDYQRFLDSFPQFRDTSLVVLTGESHDTVSDAQKRLAEALRGREDLILYLFAPGADPFFEDHAFLYLDESELDDTIVRLARAQPALTALTQDPSLRGLFDELELGIEDVKSGGEPPLGMIRISDRLSDIGEGMLAGHPRALTWGDEFFGANETIYRLIILQGREDFAETAPAERLVEEIRRTAEALQITPENGVTVRLTGRVPLAHEELATMRTGVALAGALSAIFLTVILGFGLRSLRIIVATVLALIVSLVWTTAYAMATVGEFNTISAAFGVLLLGLGVDFGIHIGLRFEEETYRGVPVKKAIEGAAAGAGGAISLCALTSAIGFASFMPTKFSGLAELGTIASGGMLFSLIASFTVLPAVFALRGPPSHYQRTSHELMRRWQDAMVRYAGPIVVTAAILAVVTIVLAYRYTSFDFSVLAMKDPEGEGMTAFRELHEQELVTDYSLTALAPDRESAESLAVELEALEEVAEARTPYFFVPSDQEEKQLALEDAAFFLESVLEPDPPEPSPTDEERLASIASLNEAISTLPEEGTDPELLAATRRLAAVLDDILEAPDARRPARELESLVIEDLPERMDWLRRAIAVDTVSFEDLPRLLRERFVDAEGRYRVVALPTGDMSDAEQARAFVDAVARVVPRATGRPSLEVGVGDVVVESFRQAIGLAFVAVLIVLMLSLRSLVDALTVLAPITLAALITVACGVLFDVPFTLANVVAVPLVLGLGVDSGIHVFMRYRDAGALEDMMSSSTPRAVLLSALTTLAAFGSLSLSPHRGFSGLGILLSISVLALIYCTLIVLPAMISLRDRWLERRGARQ
jgi:hopanoid biosynthesis associated RND transporter like protein HpnN